MDPEPAEPPSVTTQIEKSSITSHTDEIKTTEDLDEPFSFSSTLVVLAGLAIAIISVGTPLAVVLLESSFGGGSEVPTALKSDGSKSSPSISLTRSGEPNRWNSSRESE